MNKEDVLKQIKATEVSIKELNDKMNHLKEELNKPEVSRWKPTDNEEYWFIERYGIICKNYWRDSCDNNFRYNTRNCFKTREEAEAKLDYTKTHYELIDIAEELNNGQKIDWKSFYQIKYFLYIDSIKNKIELGDRLITHNSGLVYCLNKEFIAVALERIGEERLKAYLTYSEQ